MAVWNNDRELSLLYGCGHRYDQQLCVCVCVFGVYVCVQYMYGNSCFPIRCSKCYLLYINPLLYLLNPAHTHTPTVNMTQ